MGSAPSHAVLTARPGVQRPLSRLLLRPLIAGLCCLTPATPAIAQGSPLPGVKFWAGGGALFIGALFADRNLSAAMERSQSAGLDRLAGIVEPMGHQKVALPALAGSYVVTLVIGDHHASNAVLRIAAGFVAADLLESALKPAVGRHRPDSLNNDPWLFRPFSSGNEWHSMPSGHAVHAFALAAGVATEVHQPAVAVAGYSLATLVAFQRVYGRAHWPSDVVAGAMLGIATSRATCYLLRPRSTRAPGASLVFWPRGIAVRLPFQPLAH